MLRRIGLMVSLILGAASATQAQVAGAVRGTVLLPDGAPAAGAVVTLRGVPAHRTTADSGGSFLLGEVPAGRYVLVGTRDDVNPGTQAITVRDADTLIVTLQLGRAVELSEIAVLGRAPAAIADTVSAVATRTQTPLLETPQTVQTLPQRVIQDQQLATINEASKYLTGVIAATNLTQFTLRGFDVYDDAIMTDGFRGNLFSYHQNASLAAIDRVEVLKGPASVLYSTGSPGGVINFVTKQPQTEPSRSLTLGFGNWNQMQGAADLTGPLAAGGRLLYRLVGSYSYTSGASDRPFQYQKVLLVAPSLALLLPRDGRLTFQYVFNYQGARFGYDRGSYITERPDSTFNFSTVPWNYTLMSPKDNDTDNNHLVSLRLDQPLSSSVQIHAISRLVRQGLRNEEHFGDFSGDPMHVDSLVRFWDTWLNHWFNWQNSAYAVGKVRTGSVEHQILGGMDVSWYGSTLNQYLQGQATTFSDPAHPDYSHDDFASYVPDFIEHDQQRYQLIGAYVQDQLRLGRLRLMGTLRYDHYRFTYAAADTFNYTQTPDTSVAHAFLPRFGALYLLNPNLSVYASYSRSFVPQYDNSRNSGGPFPPQTGVQWEGGAKADLLDGRLTATAAAYTIDYNNILATDPTDSTGQRQIPVPGIRSRGAELTVQGQLGRLALVAGYGYNRTRLLSTSGVGNKGDTYPNAPKHIANLWGSFAAARSASTDLAVGGNVRYVSSRVGVIEDQRWFILPAYTLVDASANLRWQEYSLNAAVTNLFDTRYFPGGYYSRLLVILGDRRSFRLAVTRAI